MSMFSQAMVDNTTPKTLLVAPEQLKLHAPAGAAGAGSITIKVDLSDGTAITIGSLNAVGVGTYLEYDLRGLPRGEYYCTASGTSGTVYTVTFIG